MKGIILAGGSGTRLSPITKAVSKQLLPVYDKPMIYYPLSTLMLAGIKEILIISTPQDKPLFEKLFGSGDFLGMTFSYAVQEQPWGIADAFLVGRKFIGKDSVCLVLGDNIFWGQSFTSILEKAVSQVKKNGGAAIFGSVVKDPSSYGVISFNERNNSLRIVEKPKVPKSQYAVPGLYIFDSTCVEKAESLKPSRRGELEITDLNNLYAKEGKLFLQYLGRGMTWLDTGTADRLLEASNFIATIQKRQGLYVSCIEEIAYRQKWISKKQLLNLAKNNVTAYGEYLASIAKEKIL